MQAAELEAMGYAAEEDDDSDTEMMPQAPPIKKRFGRIVLPQPPKEPKDPNGTKKPKKNRKESLVMQFDFGLKKVVDESLICTSLLGTSDSFVASCNGEAKEDFTTGGATSRA